MTGVQTCALPISGTVMYVKKTYMPSVYIFSEEDEKLEVTTGEGAAVAAV